MIRDRKIDNSLYILDVFRNISRSNGLDATLIFEADDFLQGTITYERKERNLIFVLHKKYDTIINDHEITLSFMLKETMIDFETKIVKIVDNFLYLELPKTIHSGFKRNITRYNAKDSDNLFIILENGVKEKIKDITIKGLSFYSTNSELAVSDILRVNTIYFHDITICVDAIIKYKTKLTTNKFLYGIEFEDLCWNYNHALYSLIYEKTYPDLSDITDYDKNVIYDLYENSNYFALRPKKEIEIAFNAMYEILNKINKYPHLISNPVFYKNDKIYMGSSALQIYDQTFLAQHLAAIPESRLFPQSKTLVYLGLNDYLLSNPRFEYYLTYFDSTNRWHNRMYTSIGDYIADEKKFLYKTYEYFECYLEKYDHSLESSLKATRLKVNTEFLEYCENNLKDLEKNAYGYSKKHINLDKIKETYSMASLYLDRCILKIEKNNKIVAFAVCESYSAGLNLYNVLDLARFYFVDHDCDINEVFIAAINEMKYFYMKYGKTKFDIFTDIPKEEQEKVKIEGIIYNFLVGTVLANRNGGIEYKNLLLNMVRK